MPVRANRLGKAPSVEHAESRLQKEFEYCGVQVMIFVRGVPKAGYEGLSTADIWYCLPATSTSMSTLSVNGKWTLLTQRKMIVSASAIEVIGGADQLIRQFIDDVLVNRLRDASAVGQG